MFNHFFFVERDAKTVSVATHLLQFIFLGDGGFRFPVAHFPTAQCPASVLYNYEVLGRGVTSEKGRIYVRLFLPEFYV